MSFVVFLDVDGVLNTVTTCVRAPSEMYTGIDELRIQILAGAMRECRASGVVLTTTWKDLKPDHEDYIYLKDGLLKYGIKKYPWSSTIYVREDFREMFEKYRKPGRTYTGIMNKMTAEILLSN